MNIYVGNLGYSLSESELRDAFANFGDVSSVKILTDRETGRSRGFGFVEMQISRRPKQRWRISTARTSAVGRCARTRRAPASPVERQRHSVMQGLTLR